MNPRWLIIAALLLVSSLARADVLSSSANGFVLEVTTVVDRSVSESYAQFLRIDEWWDGDHSWFGSADNFYLEPKVGGCFCEVSGDKQAQHMRVSFVEPNKEVRLLGGLGPLQMLGVHGAMSWKFLPVADNQTRIIHRYAVTGYTEGGLDKLANVVNTVQTSQVQRLANILNAAD